MRGLGLATIVTAAGAVLLGGVPAAAPEWAAAPARAAASGWRVVPSPPSDGGFFNAVHPAPAPVPVSYTHLTLPTN